MYFIAMFISYHNKKIEKLKKKNPESEERSPNLSKAPLFWEMVTTQISLDGNKGIEHVTASRRWY